MCLSVYLDNTPSLWNAMAIATVSCVYIQPTVSPAVCVCATHTDNQLLLVVPMLLLSICTGTTYSRIAEMKTEPGAKYQPS